MKNRKETINPKNHDVLIKQIKNHPESISNIKPYINQHNWKEIDFPSYKKDWKKFEQNNKSIALKILHVPYNIEGTRHAYRSKHNLKRENWVIILMITDGKNNIILLQKNCLHYLGEKDLIIMETFIV